MSKIIVILIVFLIVFMYNSIIVKRNRVKARWSTIDTQLQRRNDLIPNLVEMVKGYAKHEKEVFENIAELRSSYRGAKSVKEKRIIL